MRRSRVIALFIIIFLGAQVFMTAQSDDLKDRFIKRKPQINKMKNAGMVGENNGGFLEFRRGNPAKVQRQIVAAENADRRLVYRRIAEKVGATVEVVGRRRAAQIARQAKPGHWLQDGDGNWYRKR
jgi:hypothetical protein